VAEYRRGAPSVSPGNQQLPFGAASAANAAIPTPAAPIAPAIRSVPRSEPDPDAQATTENMEILSAPPEPGYTPDPMRPLGRVPRYVVRNLPSLMMAARDPEAPRSIKALYRAVVAEIEAEQRRA